MTIRYSDGKSVQAVVLSRERHSIRCAVQGYDDVAKFTLVNGRVFSEEGEPVRIQFAWEQIAPIKTVSLADCICPKELAAALIQSLVNGEQQKPQLEPAPLRTMAAGASFY